MINETKSIFDSNIIPFTLAIATPIITALISLIAENIKYKRKFYTEHKAEVIELYISTTGKLIKFFSDDNVDNYGKYYGEALIYVSDVIVEKMKQLDVLLEQRYYNFDKNNANKLFQEICFEIKKDAPRQKFTLSRYFSGKRNKLQYKMLPILHI